MKKIIIALLLLGSIFANSFAQEYDVVEVGEEVSGNTNEVYLTAGTNSALPFALTVITFGLITLGENKEIMPVTFTAGYNHYFNDEHLGVGGFVSYEQFFGMNLVSLQAKITGQYGWEHVKLYHAFSLGAAGIFGNSSPQVIPMFNLTWLGLKFDFDKWNIFIDSSIGSTALLQLGASFKF